MTNSDSLATAARTNKSPAPECVSQPPERRGSWPKIEATCDRLGGLSTCVSFLCISLPPSLPCFCVICLSFCIPVLFHKINFLSRLFLKSVLLPITAMYYLASFLALLTRTLCLSLSCFLSFSLCQSVSPTPSSFLFTPSYPSSPS